MMYLLAHSSFIIHHSNMLPERPKGSFFKIHQVLIVGERFALEAYVSVG